MQKLHDHISKLKIIQLPKNVINKKEKETGN